MMAVLLLAVLFPTAQETVIEGHGLALRWTMNKACRDAYQGMTGRDPQVWLRRPWRVTLFERGDSIDAHNRMLRESEYSPQALIRCNYPDAIAIEKADVTMGGPRQAARIWIHETVHLALCPQRTPGFITPQESERRAEIVVEVCEQ